MKKLNFLRECKNDENEDYNSTEIVQFKFLLLCYDSGITFTVQSSTISSGGNQVDSLPPASSRTFSMREAFVFFGSKREGLKYV